MILLLLQVAQAQAPPPDSIERLRASARKAEIAFERLSRRLIPTRYGVDGSRCDEIVGRFCLLYDSGQPYVPAGPEHGRIVDARREAIEALRAAFAVRPADFPTIAPLVRYLVEDDRPREAASAARLYELVSGDSIWAPLLRGFAEHAAAEDSTAERLFRLALDRMPPPEREHILDLDWVLDARDRNARRKMAPDQGLEFERTFWLLADPLYMTPGNETWTEHVARHVYSRMLARAPLVADMLRWGDDLEQLTIRYGVPTTRTREPGSIMSDGPITEHYDPDQRALTPTNLTDGFPPAPLPGRPWELDRPRSRTGYAPASARRLLYMPHQLTRFPGPDGLTLRADALFAMDSTAAGRVTSAQTAFFSVDAAGNITESPHRSIPVSADTARFAFEMAVPQDARLYSIEARERETRLAGRARYAIEADTAPLLLSDPLITRPWSPAPPPAGRADPTLHPLASLIVASTDTLGLYAEAHGLQPSGPFRVRLSIEPASRASLPSRVVSWLGDKLGLSDPPSPTRLEWVATADTAGSAILALELFPSPDRLGDQVIVLQITEPTSQLSAETRRIVRIER